MDEKAPEKTAIALGDDLYGLSVEELEVRITLFQAEIERLKTEISKKRKDLDAAHQLFR